MKLRLRERQKEKQMKEQRCRESQRAISTTFNGGLVLVTRCRIPCEGNYGLSESVSAQCHMTEVVCRDALITLQQTQET